MESFWQIAVGIAGLGAIGAFVFWSLYKGWLQLTIFAAMTADQTFRLMLTFLILTFLSLLSILIVYVVYNKPPPQKISSISYIRDGTSHHGEFRRSGSVWIETYEDLTNPRYWTEVATPSAGKLRLASSGAVVEIDFTTQAIDYSDDGHSGFRRLDTITSVAKE